MAIIGPWRGGPFRAQASLSVPDIYKTRVSQQYLEILNSDVANEVRVSQQYLEILNSDVANKVRVSQQYLEILCTFGTPPPGKSGGSPGHNKPPSVVKWQSFMEREQRHRNRRSGRFMNSDVVIYGDGYAPPNATPFRHIETVKTVRIN